MFGSGVLRGMLVTLRHFVETYTEDPRRVKARAATPNAVRQTPNDARGLFTVQYPEEKLAIPERFRFYPMLIVDGTTGQDWCTSCGICAKVCPPQCIWIVRGTQPNGKPKPEPEEFYLDTTICMQCGYCAEFCPFDAIKMNHDYELSAYERHESAIYNKEMLSATTTFYARTHPRAWAEESAVRAEKEARDKAKAAPATPAPAPVAAAPAPGPAPTGAASTPSGKPKPISGKVAKAMRERGLTPGVDPIPADLLAATETAAAAPGQAQAGPPQGPAPTTGATLPSGKPKPISGKVAKAMRERGLTPGVDPIPADLLPPGEG